MIYSNALSVTSEIYNKLGQHKYKTKDPDNITEYIGTYSTGNKYIYIGQLKVGTNKAEGLGICVYNTGDTLYLNNLNHTRVFKRESGRMISLMDMGELQSCWSWNKLNANSYYDLDKWDAFNIYPYFYSHRI